MTKDKAMISAWSLREVYFDEDGEPSMHRSPPQRQWQGLREEDWEHIDNKKDTALDTFQQGAVWAADQLRERNT